MRGCGDAEGRVTASERGRGRGRGMGGRTWGPQRKSTYRSLNDPTRGVLSRPVIWD
ncbi:hypothetical protein GZL_07445 [Streptomyces sp. 769]|nr:hypothetical protein GZL_07445 [Streptomyces sp. 769]